MIHLFSTAPDAKKRRRTEVTEVTERWTGCGLCLIGRVRSVLSVYACLGILIGRGGASGHVDRTRPVVVGASWTQTGRWYCGVRFV
jgi:hypothetical protein